MTPEKEVEKIMSDIEKRNASKDRDIELVTSLRDEVKAILDRFYIECSVMGIDVNIDLPDVMVVGTFDGGTKKVIGGLCSIDLTRTEVIA